MPQKTRQSFEVAWKSEAPQLTFDQWLTARIAGQFQEQASVTQANTGQQMIQ
jgi:hypothetical protein